MIFWLKTLLRSNNLLTEIGFFFQNLTQKNQQTWTITLKPRSFL